MIAFLSCRLRSHSVAKMLPGPHALANVHATVVDDLHLNNLSPASLQNSTEAMP